MAPADGTSSSVSSVAATSASSCVGPCSWRTDATAATETLPGPLTIHCSGCLQRFPPDGVSCADSTSAGCGHYYCASCLSEYVRGAVRDRRFPVLCPMGASAGGKGAAFGAGGGGGGGAGGCQHRLPRGTVLAVLEQHRQERRVPQQWSGDRAFPQLGLESSGSHYPRLCCLCPHEAYLPKQPPEGYAYAGPAGAVPVHHHLPHIYTTGAGLGGRHGVGASATAGSCCGGGGPCCGGGCSRCTAAGGIGPGAHCNTSGSGLGGGSSGDGRSGGASAFVSYGGGRIARGWSDSGVTAGAIPCAKYPDVATAAAARAATARNFFTVSVPPQLPPPPPPRPPPPPPPPPPGCCGGAPAGMLPPGVFTFEPAAAAAVGARVAPARHSALQGAPVHEPLTPGRTAAVATTGGPAQPTEGAWAGAADGGLGSGLSYESAYNAAFSAAYRAAYAAARVSYASRTTPYGRPPAAQHGAHRPPMPAAAGPAFYPAVYAAAAGAGGPDRPGCRGEMRRRASEPAGQVAAAVPCCAQGAACPACCRARTFGLGRPL